MGKHAFLMFNSFMVCETGPFVDVSFSVKVDVYIKIEISYIYVCIYVYVLWLWYIYIFIYLFVYYLFIYLCVWVCVLWLCYIYNISVKYPETLPGIKRSNRQWPTDSLGSWQSVTPQKPLVREIPRVPITPKTIQTFWGIQLVFQIQPHNFSLNFDGKSIPNPSNQLPEPNIGPGSGPFLRQRVTQLIHIRILVRHYHFKHLIHSWSSW